jgi:hypothetical protein
MECSEISAECCRRDGSAEECKSERGYYHTEVELREDIAALFAYEISREAASMLCFPWCAAASGSAHTHTCAYGAGVRGASGGALGA